MQNKATCVFDSILLDRYFAPVNINELIRMYAKMVYVIEINCVIIRDLLLWFLNSSWSTLPSRRQKLLHWRSFTVSQTR